MFDAVVIGSSAGGIEACIRLLSMLPAGFSWPILLVQHLSPTQKASEVAKIIGAKTKLRMKEAKHGERILAGHIYIAPSDCHMVVTKKGILQLTKDQKVNYSRPSIDVLFKSVVPVFHDRVVGIILTGANEDGAQGLAAIRENGGYAIVQDPKTAVVDCMPRSALAKTYVDTVLSPEEIGIFLGEMWEISASSSIVRKVSRYARKKNYSFG